MPPLPKNFSKNLGDYVILERIAQGGMAQIYKAKTADPTGIERLVVIKRILSHISSNPEYVEMLIDEAKICVQFNHGNIAQVYDLGKIDDDYFIVMEYVDGKTLGQIVREFKERSESIPIEIIAHCILELCLGLNYLHQKKDRDGKPLNVVHRDISPQNLILSYSGTLKIIDFGVAKSMEKVGQTQSGILKGKFAYMSPEQAAGKVIDNRSDVFSAGILLWELLTGQRLFKRESNFETVKAVKKGKYTKASQIRKTVPKSLDAIIAKALQTNPKKRYATAGLMALDLRKFLLENYPDFRPLNASQFLYRYFGPEADEDGVPEEIQELRIERKPKPVLSGKATADPIDDEVTEVSVLSRFRGRQWFSIAAVVLGFILLGVLFYGLYPGFHASTFEIQIDPRDATLRANDEIIIPNAQGIHRIQKRPGQKFKLQVQKQGYLSFNETWPVPRDQVIQRQIHLEREIPPFGDLQIETVPSGAIVRLEGVDWTAPTPTRITRLNSKKTYEIEVLLEGYKTAKTTVTILGYEPTVLRVNLEIDYSTLEINSQPQGADVIINDTLLGKTPWVSDRIKPQELTEIEIRWPGRQPQYQTLKLSPGEKKLINFSLE